jgi:hypothetical protein
MEFVQETSMCFSLSIFIKSSSLINPGDFMIGLFSTIGVAIGIGYAANSNDAIRRLKQDNPMVMMGLLLFGLFIVLKILGSVMVFSFSICLPLSSNIYQNLKSQNQTQVFLFFIIKVILIHAACRRRNILNKITNTAETTGLVKTPMGVLLEYLGATVSSNFLNSDE